MVARRAVVHPAQPHARAVEEPEERDEEAERSPVAEQRDVAVAPAQEAFERRRDRPEGVPARALQQADRRREPERGPPAGVRALSLIVVVVVVAIVVVVIVVVVIIVVVVVIELE